METQPSPLTTLPRGSQPTSSSLAGRITRPSGEKSIREHFTPSSKRPSISSSFARGTTPAASIFKHSARQSVAATTSWPETVTGCRSCQRGSTRFSSGSTPMNPTGTSDSDERCQTGLRVRSFHRHSVACFMLTAFCAFSV